jgi:hypothetical protein
MLAVLSFNILAAAAVCAFVQVGSLYIIITSWQTFKVFAN